MRSSNLLTILHTLGRFVRMTHVHSQEIGLSHNITGLSLECLRWIAAGQPLSTEDLSDRFDVDEHDLLDLLDSLHAAKLIAITPTSHSHGPLHLELTLTSVGLAVVETATPPPLDDIAPSLAKLPDEDLTKLAEAMDILNRSLDEQRAPPSSDAHREAWPLVFGSG